MSHYQEGSARPSLFAVNLGYTSAFPTRALDDPRRHPNEALADFHRAADRILQGRNYSPLSETESEGENSDSGDDSDDSYESIFGGDSNTAGPTDDQREAFLSRAIDAARKQLEADFAMFHKEARNTRRTGNTHRTHRTHRERQKSRAATVPATEANSQLSEAHRPTWQQVPDNMKLILVKELTSDFSYSKAVQLLRLTVAEEAALRALYDREQRKVARHRAALDAYADQGLDAYTRQKPVQRPDEEEGRTPPYALTAIKGCYLLPPVDEPQLLTDFVSVQHMTAALDFLHGLGFAPGTVDLGHWVGHSGGGRFEMDIPDRHEVCEVGHHGRALLGSTHQETSAIRPMRESKSKQSRQSIGTKRGRPKAKTTAGGLKLKRLPTVRLITRERGGRGVGGGSRGGGVATRGRMRVGRTN